MSDVKPPGPIDQYRFANESAVVFDLTGWTVLRLSGNDSLSFFHNFCTNDIKGLNPNVGVEAFVTNVKARVISHVLAFRDAESLPVLTLLTAPDQAGPLASHLDRYIIREDVTVTDQTADTALLCVAGPRAAEILRAAQFELPADPTEPGRFRSQTNSMEGVSCTLRRVDLLAVPTFLVECTRGDLPTIDARLRAAGVHRAEASVFETLRIEARFPLSGTDITDEQLAPEVDRPWAISYTKGCYLGQEPIARIDALGHVNRQLRGLRLEGSGIPDAGTPVFGDGAEIGKITSAAQGLADGRTVALAYLRAKFAAPDTQVVVRTATGDVLATVTR